MGLENNCREFLRILDRGLTWTGASGIMIVPLGHLHVVFDSVASAH